MVRAFVLYAEQPDGDAYAEHVELCRRVTGAAFRHGPIFKTAARSDEFAATGRDAQRLGVSFEVFFADVA